MNTIDFEILRTLCEKEITNQRAIAKLTGFSLGKVNKSINTMKENDFLDAELKPGKKAIDLMNSYKPDSAIILAAGFGLRLVPLCRDIPKGILDVKGEVLIERLISQLNQVGIKKIYIVVGYMKEKFEYLIDKYGVELIINNHYNDYNNLYSLRLAEDKIHNSYIVPCDLYCEENPFRSIETYSWYMVSDELSPKSPFSVNRNYELVSSKSKPGNQEIGIAYVGAKEADFLRNYLKSSVNEEDYNEYWEKCLLNDLVLSANVVKSKSVLEINTYNDLIDADAHSKGLESRYIDIICESLDVQRDEIFHIELQKEGMTNSSFLFECKGNKYIFRIPGEGTDMLINRHEEYDVYQQIKDKKLCDEIVYINPENGYKITKFIDNAVNCNPEDLNQVKQCMQLLKSFHGLKLKVKHPFDVFKQINYYESLREGPSVYDDYILTKKKVFELKDYIDQQEKEICLCHIDSVCDNFIFSNERIYLIDWEYAGMQDPHLDIAMFAIYALYDKKQVDQLIDFYFENQCDHQTRIKIYCYVAAAGLLWSNWCEYKAELGEDFGEYSLRQYRYAKDFYKFFLEGITNE